MYCRQLGEESEESRTKRTHTKQGNYGMMGSGLGKFGNLVNVDRVIIPNIEMSAWNFRDTRTNSRGGRGRKESSLTSGWPMPA